MRGGCAVAWSSHKLRAIAMSSTEAEICAGVAGCKDITFVRNIISFMWVKLTSSTALLIDNEGMWFNIRNSGVSQRTRHFELWMQYVREQYTIGRITAHHVGTRWSSRRREGDGIATGGGGGGILPRLSSLRLSLSALRSSSLLAICTTMSRP